MRRRRRFAALLVGTVACLSACLGGAGLHEAFASQRANAWTGIANNEVLVSDTVTPLANGAVQHEVVANRASGDHQNIEYFAEVDLAEDDIEIVAGYGQNSADEWSLTRTTDQAKAYERDNPGKTVVAAINADFFNMATGEPMGALVMEGEVCHPNNGRWYFGITKDGEPVIRNSSDLSDLQMAVGIFPIFRWRSVATRCLSRTESRFLCPKTASKTSRTPVARLASGRTVAS